LYSLVSMDRVIEFLDLELQTDAPKIWLARPVADLAGVVPGKNRNDWVDC
jgi:hypothetical protein